MRWLGIDGGGTKTAFSIFDEDMEPLERFRLPGCHVAQAGAEGMRAVLREGIGRARATGLLGGSFGIGMGICGYGEDAGTTALIGEIAREAAGGAPLELVNDVEAAWAAALGMRDGIVLIAGTGSMAYGRRGELSARAGGWDYELGDEGSGGWLGRELLRAFTRQSDGRDEPGPLLAMVRRALGLGDDFDVIPYAREHIWDRGEISSLAPIVTRAAREGDASAAAILARAGREEADMVAAVARALFADAPGEVPVACVGGTFAAGGAVLGPLSDALPARCRIVDAEREPDAGACLLLRGRLC